ncbi:hypothetical protein F5X98DRAFT_217729 [Xylaria grammica]|nr:hypothetical protein F5X98DRAFT_217729 [Xylaria grammica]
MYYIVGIVAFAGLLLENGDWSNRENGSIDFSRPLGWFSEWVACVCMLCRRCRHVLSIYLSIYLSRWLAHSPSWELPSGRIARVYRLRYLIRRKGGSPQRPRLRYFALAILRWTQYCPCYRQSCGSRASCVLCQEKRSDGSVGLLRLARMRILQFDVGQLHTSHGRQFQLPALPELTCLFYKRFAIISLVISRFFTGAAPTD